ncbi:MAG: hypothetical protein QOH84_6207 [Kribbellaceae bacterium]|jgi:hypothetical protein|nr:hypothetical protein [Kribbellaceae bacterium]
MATVVLVLLFVGVVLGGWWWMAWEDGTGIPGQVKRARAFERAKRTSNEIADDGKRRIDEL